MLSYYIGPASITGSVMGTASPNDRFVGFGRLMDVKETHRYTIILQRTLNCIAGEADAQNEAREILSLYL